MEIDNIDLGLPNFFVECHDDRSITLEWDETDSACIAAGFNEMTEEDWIALLAATLKKWDSLEARDLALRAEREGPLMPREDRKRLAELQSSLLVNGTY